jgi:hypothetical protein
MPLPMTTPVIARPTDASTQVLAAVQTGLHAGAAQYVRARTITRDHMQQFIDWPCRVAAQLVYSRRDT